MPHYEELLSTDPETLTTNFKNKGKGLLNVPQIRGHVEEIRETVKYISEDALNLLPPLKLSELLSNLNDIFSALHRIHNYEKIPSQPDENQAKSLQQYFLSDITAIEFRARIRIVWPLILDSLTLLNFSRGNSTGAELLDDIKMIYEESKSTQKEYQRLYTAAKEEIAFQGISKHAKIFSDQAITHRKASRKWAIASVILILLNFGLITLLYFQIKGADDSVKVELGIMTALLISLASYVIVQFIKNYFADFAEKHNQVLNQHKANCLSSYNTFIETASDDVKGIILQYTTQTIFSSFGPGFISKELTRSP